MNEVWMDLSNNAVGREFADRGLTSIPLDNGLFTFGAGGNLGQPDAGFASYNAIQFLRPLQSLGNSTNAAGGGFVLYPNRPNTNMLGSVYRK